MKVKCKHGTFKYGLCAECLEDDELFRFKERKRMIINSGVVGVLPIGRRPKQKTNVGQGEILAAQKYVERLVVAPAWFGTQYSTAEVKEA